MGNDGAWIGVNSEYKEITYPGPFSGLDESKDVPTQPNEGPAFSPAGLSAWQKILKSTSAEFQLGVFASAIGVKGRKIPAMRLGPAKEAGREPALFYGFGGFIPMSSYSVYSPLAAGGYGDIGVSLPIWFAELNLSGGCAVPIFASVMTFGRYTALAAGGRASLDFPLVHFDESAETLYFGPHFQVLELIGTAVNRSKGETALTTLIGGGLELNGHDLKRGAVIQLGYLRGLQDGSNMIYLGFGGALRLPLPLLH